ncbi:hypothetical protein AsAng_0037030 [Aureispira anguillae]|uniref:Uncharacterized protein n=1 Tax=Aureispira anguillae TaxID=2864201 RepID=A0A915YH64_9BACT|nr:hypothetical protein AsAng_0037030 [Aureispira anguillae]
MVGKEAILLEKGAFLLENRSLCRNLQKISQV